MLFRSLAVSNWLDHTVTILDAETDTPVARLLVADARTPRGLAFTPDGRSLLVAWFGTGELTRHTVPHAPAESAGSSEPAAPPDPTGSSEPAAWAPAGRLHIGGALRHIAVHPDGTFAYISNMAARQVHAVDLSTLTVRGSVRVDSNPNTIVLDREGATLYVSCRGPNNPDGYELRSPEPGSIYVIDTATLTTREVIPAGTQPTGLALSPDGRRLASTSFQDDEVVVYSVPPAGRAARPDG